MNKKRVCNNCKKSMFTECEALKNNEEYLKIIKEDAIRTCMGGKIIIEPYK